MLALALVAAPARSQEPDEGYPQGWPADQQCPTSIDGLELYKVFRVDDRSPGVAGSGNRSFTCWYSDDGNSFDESIGVDWTEKITEGNAYLCDGESYENENAVQRESATHAVRVASTFGPTIDDLVDRFLRAAESLAAPCDVEAETSTSTTSTTEETTTSTTSEGPCVIDGFVTAPDLEGLAGVEVDLEGPGRIQIAKTSTDAIGHYRFDPPASTDRFSAERDDVEVVLRLSDLASVWELWHADSPAAARTKPFKVTRAKCTADIDLGALDELAVVNPAQPDRWPAMVTMTRRLVEVATFVADPKGLGFTMDDNLPVEIFAWCDGTAPVTCPDAATATKTEGAPFFRGGDRPRIVIGPVESASEALPGCVSDTIGHEFGHAVTADLFGGEIPHPSGRTSHGGYYVNASSNDAWIEGFASYLGLEARKHGSGPRATTFGFCTPRVSQVEYEQNYRAWSGNGKYEEWAIAGLLLDLEDGAADYQVARESSLVDRDVALVVLPGPKGKVVAGRLLHRRGPEVSVRVDLLSGGDEVGGGEAEVDADGWFYFPVPKEVPAFSSARAYGVRGGGNGADDDPFDVTPTQVWDAIATYDSLDTHPGRPVDVTGVFDVADLHAALADAFAGDRDQNGTDDVDQLFRDHGLFADPEGDRTYAPGAVIGRTDRPVAGVAAERYDAELPPSTRVGVDGPADATYIVSITYPVPGQGAGSAYVAVADEERRIEVAVPPEDSDATVSILAVAPGHLPSVVEVLEPAAFWAEAAEHDDEPFLEIDVELAAGELDASSGSTAPPLALGGGVLALGIALAFVGRKRAPVLLVAAALVGVGIGAGAWSLLSGDGNRPGTELALAADPDLPTAVDVTLVDEETTTSTSSTSTTTTTVTSGDPDRVLSADGWFATDALADSPNASYQPAQAGDADRATAWCVSGDGAGASITATFAEPTTITVVGFIAGYDKVDPATGEDRWDENRHVVTATWSFDDGTTFTAEPTGERDMQYTVPAEGIVTEGVMLTITQTDGIGDTCISDIELRGP